VRLEGVRQVVELELVVCHAVHLLPVLGVGLLGPHSLPLACLRIHEVDRLRPLALDAVSDDPWRTEDLAIQPVVLVG